MAIAATGAPHGAGRKDASTAADGKGFPIPDFAEVEEESKNADADMRRWEPACKAADEELKQSDTGMRTMACLGDQILVGSARPVVKVWQLAEGKLSESRKLKHGAVGSTCVETNNEYLVAVCQDDGNTGIWDLRNAERVLGLESSVSNALKAQFVPFQGNILVSGGTNGAIAFWDLRTGRQLDEIVPSNDPSLPKKADEDHAVKKRRRDNNRPEVGKLPSPVYSLAVSSDGALLGCGRGSGDISVMRLDSKQWAANDVSAHRSEASSTPVRALSFDATSRLLYSGSDDSHVCVLDAGALARQSSHGASKIPQLERLPAHRQWLSSVSVCRSSVQRVVLTTSWDGTAKLWDFRTHTALRTYKEHGGEAILSSGFSSTATDLFFATGGADSQLVVYTVKQA